jgi:hypothetical protein
MKIKIIALLILSCCGPLANAQSENVEIQIGDTLYFDACEGDSYTYIDYYKKTRFEKDTLDTDTISGWEFYKAFFETGDFDITRMPCELKGKYGIINHIMISEVNDTEKMVVIAVIAKGVSIAYIMEESFSLGEVTYAPKL